MSALLILALRPFIYSEGLPSSKIITSGSGVQTLAYTYLDKPLPKEPWSSLAKNQLGSFNNQVLFHFDGGLYNLENDVDLNKFLSSYSGKQFFYEFNASMLPVRIEEINGADKVIRTIAYKEKG